MRLNRRTIAISSIALPALALAAYFVFMPAPPAYAELPVCYYAGQSYSTGANIADNCQQGQSQTCENGNWSKCH